MDKILLKGLLDYLKNEKKDLEKRGFIPTLDMAIQDVEKAIEARDQVESAEEHESTPSAGDEE